MSAPSGTFKQRLDKLTDALDASTRRVSVKDQCFPTVIAIGVVVPFATMLVLFLTKPKFVQKKEGNKSLRDSTKIFWYTLGLTMLIWGGMYVANKYHGFDKLAMMCMI